MFVWFGHSPLVDVQWNPEARRARNEAIWLAAMPNLENKMRVFSYAEISGDDPVLFCLLWNSRRKASPSGKYRLTPHACICPVVSLA